MSYNHFEGQSDGDWEDRGDLSWSEADWQQFLLRQEKEVARFLRHYDESPANNVERLDWVAHRMGWDAEDWSVSDSFEEDSDLIPPESPEAAPEWQGEKEESTEFPDDDPYTLHRHPVYVVSSGLYLQIRYIWRQVLHKFASRVDPRLSWDFSEALNEAEKHALLAMQSMDMGDFLLCVVHMKRSLRGINLSMALVQPLAQTCPVPEHFRRNVLARLFDLREVALRVISDCREEERGLRG